MENIEFIIRIQEFSKLAEESLSKSVGEVFYGEVTSRLILRLLMNADSMSQSEICKKTHMKGSTVSIAVTKMEQDGYVKRVSNDNDKRSYRVRITRNGIKKYEEINEILETESKKIIFGLSPKDKKDIIYGIDTMISNIDTENKKSHG